MGQGSSDRKNSGIRVTTTEEKGDGSVSESEPHQSVAEKTPVTGERSGEGKKCASGENGGGGEGCGVGEVGGEEGRSETAGVAETERPVSVSRLPPSMAPFPCLLTLSLANNLVSH